MNRIKLHFPLLTLTHDFLYVNSIIHTQILLFPYPFTTVFSMSCEGRPRRRASYSTVNASFFAFVDYNWRFRGWLDGGFLVLRRARSEENGTGGGGVGCIGVVEEAGDSSVAGV